jgi:hypothetical protein
MSPLKQSDKIIGGELLSPFEDGRYSDKVDKYRGPPYLLIIGNVGVVV